MRKHLSLFLVFWGFVFIFSCSSSSKSGNDADVLPDADSDGSDTETIDDDSDSQSLEIVDDSDEMPDHDADLDQDSDNEEFDDTDRINGYKRCYDEIPDDPYEGFFASPGIEYWVKGVLGYDIDYELKEEDLEKVTEIGLPFKDIRGIEKLVNLESVTFFDTNGNVYDFTPLSKLKKLKTLRISFTPPEERDPNEEFINMTCLDASFSLLTNLESVRINDTELKDVSPIEQLVNLKSLDLDKNQIEFLPENIGNLHGLEYLTFSYNKVQNIEAIKSLTNLEHLGFTNNQVEDILPVKDMTKLIIINFSNNNITDISAVENFTELESLVANNNKIKMLPDFQRLGKLQRIHLSYNNISNLPNLKGLNSLTELWIGSNDLSDDDFLKLKELNSVRILDVSFNKLTKVPISKNLKSLEKLYLVGNNICDVTGFADNDSFPVLERLDLGENKIDNAEAFRKREGLLELLINKNCIKDLSPLEELKERGTHVGGMNEQLESCEDK